jgi:hypothetical protein
VSARLTARLAAAALVLAATMATAGVAVAEVDHDPLNRVCLSLGNDKPYRYTLAYRGPLQPFRGHICYSFAGYNETCVDPHLAWLTPATEITLYAPGGVPRDLLEGYVMLVRYPALSERTYRYTLRDTKPR